jgi:hypothetical protein
MVFAANKKDAAKIAKCSLHQFNLYWTVRTPWPLAGPKLHTLYTRKNDYRSEWQEGICQL